MGLDLWFRDDVRRILASKAQAIARLPVSDYRSGYEDALSDLRVQFGLDDTDSRLAHWRVVEQAEAR